MKAHSLTAMLSRLPIPLLGLAIALSAAQASCGGIVDDGGVPEWVGADPEVTDADVPTDAASDDSDANRADGMSYGDGYSP